MNLKRKTFEELADLVDAVWVEVKRRNPIGVNWYGEGFARASHDLREIHEAELLNPTVEAGPGSRKARA